MGPRTRRLFFILYNVLTHILLFHVHTFQNGGGGDDPLENTVNNYFVSQGLNGT